MYKFLTIFPHSGSKLIKHHAYAYARLVEKRNVEDLSSIVNWSWSQLVKGCKHFCRKWERFFVRFLLSINLLNSTEIYIFSTTTRNMYHRFRTSQILCIIIKIKNHMYMKNHKIVFLFSWKGHNIYIYVNMESMA